MTGCRYLCIQQRVSKELTCIISLNIAVYPHLSHIVCHISVICFIIWCLLSGKGCVCCVGGCGKIHYEAMLQFEKVLAKLWKTLRPFHSTKGGHPGHLGERTAGAADWTRRLQAQRYLRVCTHRQWQDSCICHTCHTGELPTISFGQDMHTTCVGSAACVCVKKEHVERLFRWTEDVFYHQVLMERVVCEVRALAVLPTKELTQQVRIF